MWAQRRQIKRSKNNEIQWKDKWMCKNTQWWETPCQTCQKQWRCHRTRTEVPTCLFGGSVTERDYMKAKGQRRAQAEGCIANGFLRVVDLYQWSKSCRWWYRCTALCSCICEQLKLEDEFVQWPTFVLLQTLRSKCYPLNSDIDIDAPIFGATLFCGQVLSNCK